MIYLYDCDNTIKDHHKVDRMFTQQHKLGVIIRKKYKNDLVTFLHAACFSPVESTLIKAIQNKPFTTWPGMECNFMPKSYD